MSLTNEIVLRPRFKFDVTHHNESILELFEDTTKKQSDFIVSRVDDHIFIKIPKAKQHFWSPQLHLEINKVDDNSSTLHGLFGPNPTVWTLFMFLHFLVAVIFIAFAIWTYTNWTLNQSYAVQASITLLMILIWVTLYFAGSIGKASSTNDMRLLNDFINNTLMLDQKKRP